MSAMADGASIFKPAFPGLPVAVFLLIENSQTMMPHWPDLRDRYLPTILKSVKAANPDVQVGSTMLQFFLF